MSSRSNKSPDTGAIKPAGIPIFTSFLIDPLIITNVFNKIDAIKENKYLI